MLSDKGSLNPANISSLPLKNSAFLIGQAHPERCDSSLTLKGSRTGPSLSSAKSTDCCPCGWTHGAPEPVRARPAGPNIEPCAVSPTWGDGSWPLEFNTTGVHLHSTLEFTIIERPSLRHFSLPAPSSLCIFIYGLRPAVPLRPTGPTGPILHPTMCLLRREDSLNPNSVKNNLGVSRDCNFGHRIEPSRPSTEASRDSRSRCKYPNASIVPCTTEVCCKLSYTVLWIRDWWFFQMVNSASFPCFCPVSFIQSHLPFPCTMYVWCVCVYMYVLV